MADEQEVIDAARKVQEWCKTHHVMGGECNCPFFVNMESTACALNCDFAPEFWGIGSFVEVGSDD